MKLVEAAYDCNLGDMADYSRHFYPGEGVFIQSLDDSSKKPAFEEMYKETPATEIARGVFGSDDIWHYEDQLFYKEGSDTTARRTPWHQDTSYHPMEGEKIAVIWIPLDDVTDETALEVIPGSHKATLYNGTTFSPDDDTTPVYSEGDMPRLPNIQGERDKWNIVTCAMMRGDALVFNTSTLHGGGPTPPGTRRRSLSLRIVGDDVVRAQRPGVVEGEGDLEAPENRGYDGEYDLQTRLTRLAVGEPVYKGGLTKL